MKRNEKNMNFLKLTILLFVLFLHSTFLFGQTPNLRVNKYSLEEGLSHRLVTRIEKDNQGFIWLATPNGLNRFDGYEFLHFSSGEGNKYPISNDYIGEIEPVKNNKMVILYKDNLTNFDFFDPSTFEVSPIVLKNVLGETAKILSISTVKNDLVYILWKEQDHLYLSSITEDGKSNVLSEIFNYGFKWSEQLKLSANNHGFLILDPLNGLFQLNPDNRVQEIPIENIDFNGEQEITFNFIKEAKNGGLWLSIKGSFGIYLYDKEVSQFNLFPTPIKQASIPRMWEDEKGNLLFGQAKNALHPIFSNFYLLDTNETWSDFSYFKNLGQFIVDVESKDFFKTTLFATVSGFKIAINKSSIIKTLLNEPIGSGDAGAIIRGMVAIDDTTVVIVDEDEAWHALDLKTDTAEKISLRDSKTGQTIPLTCGNQFHFDESTGILWGVVCQNESSCFLKINPKNWTAEKISIPKKIRSFCRLDDGKFWLICSSSKGNDVQLFSYNSQTNSIKAYTTSEGQNPIEQSTPTFLQKSKFGHLWLGTMTGLYAIDVVNHTVDYFNQETGLSGNQIQTLLELEDEKVLIGTNKGLDYFDFATNTKVVFNKRNGLSASNIYGLIEGNDQGSFWVSTILGLNYFDLKSKSFLKFFERDGLTANEFNRFAHFKDIKGRYYFGGVNGLNIFKEKDLLNIPPPPKIRLTKVEYFDGQSNKIKEIRTNLDDFVEITLKPNDKNLAFFFMLPEFSDPTKNQYQVKLDGYDEDWMYLGTKNSVRYNALPDGDYKLMIKGARATGNWTEQSRNIKISVLKVFYKTWQFWLLVSFLIGVLIHVINRYQLKQKLNVERLRTKLSSDLHDEVSGLLSGIAMQSELLEMMTSDEKNKAKLGNIAKVSRSAMSRMSDVIWSIDSRRDKVSDLLVRMSEHAMDILDPLNIEWKIETINIKEEQKMPVLLRENLYFIFKEAINNIGKHADTTKVHISFGNQNKQFKMSIHNNGQAKKIDNKTHKKGQGSENMLMRAKKIDAKLSKETSDGYTIMLTRKPFA